MVMTVLYPLCIKVLVHGTVDFCVQYHDLMHTGDFTLFRGMLEVMTKYQLYLLMINGMQV
jgi:hypothetical protein